MTDSETIKSWRLLEEYIKANDLNIGITDMISKFPTVLLASVLQDVILMQLRIDKLEAELGLVFIKKAKKI